MTNTYINNEESILLAMQKISSDSKAIKEIYLSDAGYIAFQIAQKYNPGDYKYAHEVRSVFNYISTCFYKEFPDSYDELAKIVNWEE